jgi:uncharacterized protein (TIGR02466 family)
MPIQFSIFPLFPQTVSVSHLEAVDPTKIIKILKKLDWMKTDFSKEYPMNGNNYVTCSFNILHNFKGLEQMFSEHVSLYIKNVLKYETDFKIYTCWSTKTEPDAYSRLHNHSNSWLSGIYYPEGNKDFKVSFIDSKTEWFKDRPIEYNTYNETVKEFTANKNMLIIFPSSIRHQILPNKSKKDRYSIAFNIMPRGKFNYPGDSQIDLSINI